MRNERKRIGPLPILQAPSEKFTIRSWRVPLVLTHGLLLHRVWGPERVGDAWPVRDMVKQVRHKLGDNVANPRYIFAEPRVGYRMAS